MPTRAGCTPTARRGRDACLADFRDLVAQIETKLDTYFDLRPKQALKIQKVPPHMEEGSPAAFYMPPSLDGSRDGVFYANLGDISAQFKFGMRTLYGAPTRSELAVEHVLCPFEPLVRTPRANPSLGHWHGTL